MFRPFIQWSLTKVTPSKQTSLGLPFQLVCPVFRRQKLKKKLSLAGNLLISQRSFCKSSFEFLKFAYEKLGGLLKQTGIVLLSSDVASTSSKLLSLLITRTARRLKRRCSKLLSCLQQLKLANPFLQLHRVFRYSIDFEKSRKSNTMNEENLLHMKD